MMIKTLYKEKCLRYFIIPEIILLFIFFFKFSILVYIILPLYVIESIFDNIFFNIPLIWLLFKIIIIYFSFKKLEKINRIKDKEKRKKYKIKLKIIIFFTHVIVLGIFIKFIDKFILY